MLSTFRNFFLRESYYALGNEKKKPTFLWHFSRLFVTLWAEIGDC